jgi:nicotinamidase-related amidase
MTKMSDTAVIVIDAQESFRQRQIWFETETASYLEAQQALIDGARARGIPVVRILHVEPEGVFSKASGFVKPLAEIKLDPDAEFIKTRHSALVGTGLDVWLTEHGIRRLIISGIRTEQCCETTARHASDLGWTVDFVNEATLSFATTGPDGVTHDLDAIRSHVAAALHNRFARVCTVAEALDTPKAAAA